MFPSCYPLLVWDPSGTMAKTKSSNTPSVKNSTKKVTNQKATNQSNKSAPTVQNLTASNSKVPVAGSSSTSTPKGQEALPLQSGKPMARRAGVRVTRSLSAGSTGTGSRSNILNYVFTPTDLASRAMRQEVPQATVSQSVNLDLSTESSSSKDVAPVVIPPSNTEKVIQSMDFTGVRCSDDPNVSPIGSNLGSTPVGSSNVRIGINNSNSACEVANMINFSSSSAESPSNLNTQRDLSRNPVQNSENLQVLSGINLNTDSVGGVQKNGASVQGDVVCNSLEETSPMDRTLYDDKANSVDNRNEKRTYPDSSPEGTSGASNPNKLQCMDYSKIQSELDKTKAQLREVRLELAKYKESVQEGSLLCETTQLRDELYQLRKQLAGALSNVREKEKELSREKEVYEEIVHQLQEQIEGLHAQNKSLQAQINGLAPSGVEGQSPLPVIVTETQNLAIGESLLNNNEIFNRNPPSIGAEAVASDNRRGSQQTDIVSNGNRNLFRSEHQRNEGRSNKAQRSDTAQDASASLNISITKQIIFEVLKEVNLIPRAQQLNNEVPKNVGKNQNNNVRDDGARLQKQPNQQGRSFASVANASPVRNQGTNYSLIADKQRPLVNINDASDFPQLGGINRRKGKQNRQFESQNQGRPNTVRPFTSGVRPVPVRKYVYRPLEDQEGNRVPVVLQLQKLGIKSVTYGVVNYQPLYDGALSISFNNEANRIKFEEELKSREALILAPSSVVMPYEVRIHRVNVAVDVASIEDEILRQTGLKPVKVEVFPYKDIRYVNNNFGVITCSAELYSKFREMGRINIGWVKHRVDTLPLPIKCKACGLLGHTAKRCAENSIPSAIKNKVVASSVPTESEPLECVDCMAQNHINKRDPRYVVRKTDHKRLSLECKTYRKMSHRKLKFLGDVTNATGTDAQQQTGNSHTPLTVNNLEAHNRLMNQRVEIGIQHLRSDHVDDIHMEGQEFSSNNV